MVRKRSVFRFYGKKARRGPGSKFRAHPFPPVPLFACQRIHGHIRGLEGIDICLTENELEDVVVDEVVATILEELECLGVVHGALLLIDLKATERIPLVSSYESSKEGGERVLARAYQELSGDEDQDTVVESGLGIEGRDLVLDLLEGETLKRKVSFLPEPYRRVSGIGRQNYLTASFSTIAVAPRTEADSKVSMDCSRCPP